MKPCKKCGSTERYKCGRCAQCSREKSLEWRSANIYKANESSAEWRKNNPERQKEIISNWRKSNPEKVKAANVSWHKLNKEKANATSAAWSKANLEKKVAYNAAWRIANIEKARYTGRMGRQNRRAREKGKLSKDLGYRLFELQKGKCACCHARLEKYHLDHIMPLALDGANADSNIQLLCPTCNLEKHAKHPIDFMQSRGFLL
jgi:5-methylcytosine-specific restriction endonuclease McrA